MPEVQTPVSTDEIIANAGEETVENEGFGFGDDIFDGDGTGGFATDEPFFLVEVMPSFRGGDINRFREWVQKRTNYPQEALDKKIQGRIFLTFIVEADGAVSNVTVVKGVDPLIDSEAVKAIEASPKWTPGLQRGQPVRVRYSLWLSFVI
jgi:protein TonB